MESFLLEACVDSVDSAIAAVNGGADRLELCADLALGGTTPGINLFYAVKNKFDVPVHVLIRPRAGDFCYSDEEFSIMKDDVAMFRDAGADGIVTGILNPDGSLDVARMDELLPYAGKMNAVMNRAFDLCRNPAETLEQVKMLGMHGLLTSGQQKDCYEGRSLIAQLVLKSGDLQITAAGGVNCKNIVSLARVTGAKAFQLLGIKRTDSSMEYRKSGIPMRLPELDEYSVYRAEVKEFAAAKVALDEISR